MKKIILLLVITSSLIFAGCEGPEGPRGETGYSAEAAVYEYQNADITLDQNGDYSFRRSISTNLEDSVLIYRLSGTINSQTPIWQPIPRTVYLDNGNEFDYDYDFSRVDFSIYAGGNYNIALSPELLYDQTFRVVVIPGQFANKGNANAIDLSDYEAVIKAYHIDESKIKSLN
ncbi:hypothetical protein G4D82_07060 [Flavobacterium sp. CYK-4]|uniref:hypothetical protein n=1 Tax=Flavobacterium lotistagni TaxID=2709660 RepID=UPI00140C2F59|nr:hypothetical protein [Flavobacterium lotistagni]NHM06976.1 hypothetical protein [Flavobacterium lotistagni]